jgi:hypothetical protein
MSTTFEFKCWQPSDMDESDAVQFVACYAIDAAYDFVNNRLIGHGSAEEHDGAQISVRDPFGHVEQFVIDIEMQPAYSVTRVVS